MSAVAVRGEADAVRESRALRIGIVGMGGDEHLGGSLVRAARSLGHDAELFDAAEAWGGSRLVRAFNWRFRDRLPTAGRAWFTRLRAALEHSKSDVVVATGMAPLDRTLLRALRARGVATVNFSTDDPWNPAMASRWFQESLPEYDIVFTPRRSNAADFARAGCADVRYLPFGYDPRLLSAPKLAVPAHDVVFVGGADDDRAEFMRRFMRHGPAPALVGGYWQRYRDLSAHALGVKVWEEVAALTRAARVNLCLVRRANRDGHVMRSLEIAACGGCLLAEDTADHRELFGPAGETALYFSSPEEAAHLARRLLADPVARKSLAARLERRIAGGGHSYADRIGTMVRAAAALPNRAAGRAEAGAAC